MSNTITQLNQLKRLKNLKRDNGIVFYEPHLKQDMFHRAGDYKRRYVRTGNRFGKSTLGVAEDLAWALGERPWYKKDDPDRYKGIPKKSNKILILVQDWDKVNEVFTNTQKGQSQGKIFELLPSDSLAEAPKKSKSGVVDLVKIRSIHGGVSTIHFDTVKSFAANAMGQESSDWDAIHVDEPIPKAMWIANSRGLIDRGGFAWFTCTPITQGWINDMFVPRKNFRQKIDTAITRDNFWMISGSTYDNPHLTEESIKLFEADLTEAQKQCRLQGIPLSLEGIVYKQFEPDKHTYTETPHGWENMWTPPDNYTIRVAIDPHPETPHAVLFAATAPTGQVYFYSEIFEHCIAEMLCKRINEILIGYEPHTIIMDPAGFIENPTDGSSMADIFDEHGLFVDKAPKDLKRGIVETQNALKKRLRTPLGNETTWLNFSQHLETTLFEFDHYEWNPRKPNSPVDKDDHMMENLYRLVICGLEYVDPQKLELDPNTTGYSGNYSRNRKFYGTVK